MMNESFIALFQRIFNTAPSFIVRAPGRVNLIGEHTDYNGLPVLPISIPSAVKIAVSPRSDTIIRIHNMNPRYEPISFEVQSKILRSPQGHWANYCKAAISTLASHTGFSYLGMDALIDSEIPESAGLSSSSALVIASALALLAVNQEEMDPLELAGLMAEGEQYVGTQGGGMDQAVCLLGKNGKAVKIDFFPLRYTYLPFPEQYSILAAHSLIRASKTNNALFHYNLRSVECRLATAVINAVYKPEKPLAVLGDLPHRKFFTDSGNTEDFIVKTFRQDSYSLQEIAEITHEPVDSLKNRYVVNRNGILMLEPGNGFFLRRRTRHVLAEARRVEESCEALLNENAERFGKLMFESHQSCDKNYNISTPEMNTLASIMTESGALGARMTGAGFGGYVIGLVHDHEVQSCLDSIVEKYYHTYIREQHRELHKGLTIDDTLIFSVKPSRGAEVIKL